MSQTFHSKYHRANHMTLKNPNLPDAGWDPIASDTVPFSGDFWMAEDYAVHTNYIKPATGTTGTSVTVWSDKFNVSGDSEFAKTIIVDGYEYIHGADDDDYGLKVDNKIYVGSGVDIAGDLDISGNLYVTGGGKTAYIKNLSAEFATITSATITKVDIVESESYGYIMHTTAVAPKIIDTQSLTAGVNNFYLSGDTLYSDSWGYFEGELKTASAFYADGPVTFANTLNVTGKATFDNEILAASSITTNKNLYVTGNAKVGAFGSFGTYVSAAGSDNNGYGLIIEKNANIKGNTDIGGTLGVTGAVDFDSTLNVDGAATLNTLSVTSNATVGGTLGVTGATTLNTLNATGAADFDSTLNVDGATTLNGGVTVKTSSSNKSTVFDGEKIYRKNGTQSAGTFLFPSYGGTLVARPNSPLPPSGNIPMFDEYGNIVDSGNNVADKANSASLAAPYETNHSSAYVVGDYVTHEGTLYKCKSDTSSPPGEWDDNNWTATNIDTAKANDDAVVKLTGNQTIAGTKTFTGNCEFNGSMQTAGINALGGILANGITVKGGFNLGFIGGGNIIMDGGAVSITKDGFVLLQRIRGPQYPPNFIVLELDSEGGSVGQYNILLPIANGTVAIQSSIAPVFSDSETYAVGDYVVYEGLLYKCATAVETSGSWTGNTNWTEATVTDEMATVGYVDSKIGDINSVLDSINGEVI